MIVASFDAAGNGLAKPTVVRTRGMCSVKTSTNVLGDTEVTGALGVAVVSDLALAAGAASIPGPFSEAGWDGWMVWQSFCWSFRFDTAAGLILDSIQFDVDSKAMRKITDDESLVVMAESQSGPCEINAPLRMLLKLS